MFSTLRAVGLPSSKFRVTTWIMIVCRCEFGWKCFMCKAVIYTGL